MPKRATSKDVARLANVSRTTVSLVLNNVPDVRLSHTTRIRVMNAARELNYHPNVQGKKLASGKSSTLGLVMWQDTVQTLTDSYLLKLILGVERSAEQAGFRVMMKPIEPETSPHYGQLIRENHVDGILLSSPRYDDKEIIHITEEGFPVVLIGQLPGHEIPFVDIDSTYGAKNATQYLIHQGHKHIAMIAHAPLEYDSARQRIEGYQQALTEAGLEPDDNLLRYGSFTPASGYDAMTELLDVDRRPTAVFISSDLLAMGAMQAIKYAGLKIPSDIAVVGFDDIPLAEYYDPPLTTVRLPAYGMGWAASELLILLVQGDSPDQQGILLDTELIVRKST